MIRGMGMRIGSCAMTGFTSSTLQRLSSVVMAMFALYQAAGRYAIRCLQRIVNLVPATICLASALVFSSAVGAAAQDTTAPVGVFELPASHDGITPFTAVIVFDEEPKRIWPQELVGLLIRGSTDPETQTQPVQIYTNTDHAPLITKRKKDDDDKRRYTFLVTPRAPVDIRFRLSGGYTDIAGNVGPTISSPAIPYVAPAGGNNQPEANAGPDQVVDPGDTVTLDGSESSDRDGNETITYSWARTGGTAGVTAPTLTGSTTDSPTFTADTLTSGDDDVVHVFTLTVTDDHEETDTDTMTVTVEAPDTNPVPIASAGVDQEVISGALVTLDGSASGDDGRIVSWAWERTGGTEGLDATVPLNNPNAIKPTFTANTLAVGGGDVIHIFTLIVTDNEGATGIDTVAVIIKAPLFAAPVANAGPDQTFDLGATVTLDGSGSTFDSRRTPLDYAWKRTGGTADPVTLAGADTAMPTFTAVAPALLPSTPFATHIFELTVTDSAGEISTDTVTVWIVIPTARSAPVANAGMDRTVTSRAAVRLDGSGSTVHSSRTIRSYAWRWVKPLSTPNVEAITLTDPNTAMPGFTAPTLDVGAKDITHVFELTVTDSAGQTNKDTVSITVIFPFANPVANAGQDRKVGSGTVVTLDGSDSTIDLRRPGASKSYAWARTGGTGDNTVTLTSETTAKPSFMAETLASNDTDVTHIFTLTVTDSAGVQHTDTVTITVTLGNADPVANAGDDQPAVVSGTTVTLDGSRSSDSDGSISKFAWARTGGTGDDSITLSSVSEAEPTFRAEILQAGAADVTHIFTLTVTDDDQATATDTVTITVTPANAVPIANAGQDRTVDPATMVQLDGSDSLDIDGRIVSYSWARTGGTAGGSATLTDAMTDRPTFTSDALQMDDADVIHIFTLTVTDDDGGIDTATVTITVSFGDTVPPTGRFEAEDGGPVPHSYGSITPFKLELVFNEEVTVSGSDVTAVISDETPVKDGVAFKNRTPTITDFKQDETDTGRYVFTVTPRDTAVPSFRIVLRARNYQDSAGNRGVADIVTAPILYVDPTVTNTAPVADAGDDLTVNSGMRNVRLDGTGSSDTEGEIRTYAWARTGGTASGSVTLSDESAAQPTFTADTLDPGGADVTHEFTLTVTDMSRHAIHEQTRQRNPETGVTTVISDTMNPVPSACRDGRASDEHCTLAYRNSAEDTVTVTVDAPPLADAGDDQTAGSAALVTLDGSGSRDSNTGFEHAWEWTGGSEGATAPTLNDKSLPSPTFTSDTVDPGAADVTHTFTLTVTDSRLQSHTDTVTVTVSNPNADPVANAGPDREVLTGTVVTLNGSGSSDSDGDDTITTYSWARTGGTEGVAAPTLAATAQPTFTADTLTPGDADVIHIFTLTVTDNAGAMDTDTVTITVVAEDTTRPEGTFVSSASHDGATSFTVELVFNEEVEFSEDDLQTVLVGVPAQNLGSNPRFHYDLDTHVPTISGFTQDPNDDLRYTFSVTPKVPLSLRIVLRGRNYEDLSGNTGTNISITIPFSGPSNKRPVAEAGDDLTVASGTEVTLDGSESMDEDGTVQYYAWVRTGGTGDPLALTDADTDMPTFTPRLSGGTDDVTHIFTLWVSDNDLAVSEADTVTVTVTAPTAPNVVPVADAGDDRTVQSGVPATLDGGESSDDDGTIKSWAWTRTGGTGNASLALTGADREQSTFTADILAPGAEDVTHIFSLVVLDDVNVPSVADTVTITVNAPPLANAGSDQTSDSAALVTLDGSGSRDSNTTNLTYAWERTGGTTGGTVTLTGANTNMPTFTADTLAAGAADVIHTFTLTVTDDEGAINTDTVTITVDGPNKRPEPMAGPDQTVASGAKVTLDGRGSTDSDGFVMGYDWRKSGDNPFANPDLEATDTAGIETFTAPVLSSGEGKRTIRYALFVTDNEGLSSGDADEVTITVVPSSSNARPVANAGTDQRVASGATVTLEGSGTDNGTIQDYYWVKASTGSAPTLSANNVARPTFTAPILVEGSPDVTYTYALRVKDNEGAVSDADEVTITVEIPRVANAGTDQTVAAGAPVTLDGSGSSGTIAEYQWSRESGTSTRTDVFPGASGTLTREVSRTTPTITFVADSVPANGTSVTHVFALRVFGANRISSPKDEITVTVNPNRLPTANAGPDQSVAAGMNVDLDGSGSTDNDGTIASYNWTRTEGDATATLTGANTATPSFTAEVLDAGAADTTHTFTLTVTDNNGETDTDTVTITVKAPLAALVANAGADKSVASEDEVTLDGSGSSQTDSSRIVTYLWTQTVGTGGTLADADKATARFTAPALNPGAADATHTFTLTVTDNQGSTQATDTVEITVTAPDFDALVANAGADKSVASEDEVTLDGSGSSQTDGTRTVTYLWTQTGGTGGTLADADKATARFTAPALNPGAADATHTFTLTVTDNQGSTQATDTVEITVTAPDFDALVANAGADKSVASEDEVTLDGSGSSQTDGTRTVTYLWTQTVGTGGTLADADKATARFTAPALNPGAADATHTFTLTVTDNQGSTQATDTVTVTVTAPLPVPNVLPIANAGPDVTIASGESARIDGNMSYDPDHPVRSMSIARWQWFRLSSSGSPLQFHNSTNNSHTNTPAKTVAPDAAADISTYYLIVFDHEGASCEKTVAGGNRGDLYCDSVTVTTTAPAPLNMPPVAVAYVGVGDSGMNAATVDSDSLVFLNAAGSDDPDGDIVSYFWERSGGTEGRSVELKNAETKLANFTTDTLPAGAADVIHIFKLTVTDDDGEVNAEEATVTITVESPFKEPVADAGGDQTVASGATVELDGSGSTKDRRITEKLTYFWERTGGTMGVSVELSDAGAEQPTFIADTLTADAADVIHIFTLTVTDDEGESHEDMVTITVTPPLAPLVANAGEDQSVSSGATVTLRGSGTKSDSSRSRIVSYNWERTSGTGTATVMLSDETMLRPTFTADTLTVGASSVTHVFTLTVTDNKGSTEATDTVTVTVTLDDVPPVADAGVDATVNAEGTIALDGRGSTVDSRRTPLTYSWTRPVGATGTLTGANTATPSFTAAPLAPGAADVTHVFTLTVTDANNASDTDTVTLTVNAPPLVNAGADATVNAEGTIALDGTGSSDSTGTPTYAWTRPVGATGTLTGANTATPSFTAAPLAPGAADVTHVFTLTVTDAGATDGVRLNNVDTVTITVNAPPRADAGDNATVNAEGMISLDGTGSSDTTGTYTYVWTRPVGATGTLTDADSATPDFTAAPLDRGAADVTHVFTLTVTDAGATDGVRLTNVDTVTITVNAPPLAVVEGEAERTVNSGASVVLDGSNSSDTTGTLAYGWTRTGGNSLIVPVLTGESTHTLTFTADTLAAGTVDVTHEYTLTVTDAGATDGVRLTDDYTVMITVTSPFADPVASAVVTGGQTTITSGETITLDGSGSMTDRRRTIMTYAWTGETSEVTASLTKADEAVATFTAETLAASAPDVTHTFTLTVTDSAGASDTATVMITVTSNALPVATVSGGNQTVASGAAVTLTGSGTDTDSDDATLDYKWTRTTRGTSTNAPVLTGEDTKTLSFTADTLEAGDQDVTHIFELVVTDTKGAESAPVEVTITIESAIAVPVARAVTSQSEYDSGATVTLDGSGSTVDFRKTPKTHAWTGETSEVTASLTKADEAMATFTADTLDAGAPDVTHTFTLTVTDSDNRMATDTVEVTINAPFADPVASAVITGGHTMVASGGTVMLDGSGSMTDRRRTIMTYAWTGETSEVTASLTKADEAVATFTAETLAASAPDVTHTFTLTVTDSAGASDTATVMITVTSNALPVATVSGGNQTVASGAAVTLTGSGTDTDSDDATLDYKWTRTTRGTSTNAPVLTGEDTKTLSFTADTLEAGDQDVTHIFELVVTDTKGAESAPVEVTITIESAIAVPVARAVTSQSEYDSGATVTLDGSGSTVDFRKTPKTHAWTGETPEVTASLTKADEAMATFTADTLDAGAPDVTHTFTLTVTDSDNRMATDTVEVTINAPFADPVASAVITGGHTMVASGGTVMLDGSGSMTDRRRTIMTYAWTGETSEVTASLTKADEAVATFTAETLTAGASDVIHTFTLTVTDSAGASDTAMVMIMVTSNALPVATVVTTTREFASGTSVELMGSGTDSDSDNATLTYAWDRTGGTGNAAVVLTGKKTATLSFTADTLVAGTADKTHVFELVVTDIEGAESEPVEVTITITAPFAAPVADAGLDQVVDSGRMVLLNGTGSETDRRRTLKAFNWRRVRGSGGSVTLNTPSMESPTFTADTLVPGAQDVTHVFELIITDSEDVVSAADEVEITVNAPPNADAGTDATVNAAGMISLDGTGSSDTTGTPTYAWTQSSGTGGTLTDANMKTASFTAPALAPGAADVTQVFTLTVTDENGATDVDTVTITVNAPPLANAGTDATVNAGGMIPLVGTGSSSDTTGYAWTRSSGTGGTLTDANMETASFMAPALAPGDPDVTQVFTLTVTDAGATDGTVLTNADTVTITVNAPPKANAGTDATVNAGGVIALVGTGSSSDTTGYAWTRSGTGGTLTDANMETASFTAPALAPGDPDVTQVFTLTVTDAGATDGTVLTNVDTVTITVNAPPLANAGTDATVNAGGVIPLVGTGSSSDTTGYAWTRSGTGGTLTDANMETASFMAPALAPGDPDVTQVFTLTVTDAGATDGTVLTNADTVTITVNAPPLADAGTDATVNAGGVIALVGTGSSSDTTGYAWTRSGTGGTLTDANMATASFTAPALAPGAADVTQVFTLTVTDAGATDGTVLTNADTVTITVNAPPLASAGTNATVNAGGVIALVGTGSSSDTTGYAWTRSSGTGGTLTDANMATASFTAPALNPGDPDATHVFTLTVTDAGATDGTVLTNVDTVTITVNAPPLANAGTDATVNAGGVIPLVGTGSSDTTGTPNYAWTQSSGTGGTLTDANMKTASFTAPALNPGDPDATHVFTLTVTDAGATDGTVLTNVDTVTITVNAPPLANAGTDATVNAGGVIPLVGTGSSDTTGTPNYAWTQSSGTGGTLTDANKETASFTAPALNPGDPDATHVFTLTVTDAGATDGTVLTNADTVTITVNAPPLVNAGTDATVNAGGVIPLVGTGSSDTTGTPNYAWTQSSGTGGTLTDANMKTASFTAPALNPGDPDATHVFTLTVTDAGATDGTVLTNADTVTITVNAPPRADAGDDVSVAAGRVIALDGTGSSSDTIGYAWTRPAGATGTLTEANTATPSFTAAPLDPGAEDVIHVFTLTVTDAGATDGAVLTNSDTVEVTVISSFAPPVANAGADQNNIASGATVTLDGSGSTKDRRKTLNYAWTRTPGADSGTGGTVILSNPTDPTDARSTFTAETLTPGARDETYSFTLTVTDDDASDTDTVTITVISPFADPVANAVTARPEVGAGDTVILDGSGSSVDRRRGRISYAWARTGGTGANVTLTGATEEMASFTADMLAAGAENVTHTFTLTVTDSTGARATDTVEVIVTANARPVATLTGPATLTVAAGAPVTLEGSGTDRDNNLPLAYAWKRTGGTGNSAVVLTGAMTTRLSFTADNLPEGADSVTHILQFVVTDNEGAESDPVTVTVTVDAPNAIPVAHAGPPPPPVASGGQIQLDGRGSSVPGGTIVAWAWTRTGGTPGVTVTLTGANTAQPTVMANDLEPGGPDETHEFTLVVTDDEGMTSVGATVMVTISAPIAAPVANAGPDQRAVSRATVRLDGRGSTPDRRKTITSYAWERTGGTGDSNLTLTGANTAQPTFTADTLNPGVDAVTHIFTLTVTDGDGTTSTDTVTVTVVSVDLRLSQSEIMVQEGGSGTYQVKLSESPRREVTIMAVSGNEDVVKLNNARLVFDGGNWNEWQEVEINTVAGSNTNDPVVIRHRLVTAGATSPVPGDVTVTLRPRADDPIPRPVGQFLQTRATALINNQPGLSSLLELDGPTPGGSFTFQATDGQLALNGGFIHNGVWGKVSGAYASSESAAGNTKSVTKSVLASFGVHRKYSEHFLAGVMLQLDLSDHERAGQVGTTDTIDGTGWLAGPYLAARHGSQPLNFEGRLLYGQSDNDIRFMDTGLGVMRTGSFDTRRLLAQIRVEGEIAMSGRNHGDDGGEEGPRLRPYADLRWIEDRANAFTDNVNNRVPGQKVSTGQLELGSNIEIPIAVRTGEMTFTGGLGLVYSNTEGDYIPSDSRGRGRGEIGFSYDLDDNLRIDLDSFYDGIGTSRYEGYGLSLSAEMKF